MRSFKLSVLFAIDNSNEQRKKNGTSYFQIIWFAVIKSTFYTNTMWAAFSRGDNLGQYMLDIFRKWWYRKKRILLKSINFCKSGYFNANILLRRVAVWCLSQILNLTSFSLVFESNTNANLHRLWMEFGINLIFISTNLSRSGVLQESLTHQIKKRVKRSNVNCIQYEFVKNESHTSSWLIWYAKPPHRNWHLNSLVD